MTPRAEEIRAAEALFDTWHPRNLKSAQLPFHLWHDATQAYALDVVRKLGLVR